MLPKRVIDPNRTASLPVLVCRRLSNRRASTSFAYYVHPSGNPAPSPPRFPFGTFRRVVATHFAFCTLHFALCTLHFAFCTLHFAFCTLHFALCILHFPSDSAILLRHKGKTGGIQRVPLLRER